MPKSQEQRVNALADFLANELNRAGCHELARRALEAADREPWPSDESVRKFRAAYRSSTNGGMPLGDEWVRDCLREAFLADPILQAAVALRDMEASASYRFDSPRVRALIDAVNEAGL
jgi:hypothetical protein